MNVRFMTGLSVALGLLVLMACTTDERHPTTSSADPDEGRYHEKSFSWTEASGPLAKGSALAAITSKETRFSSAEEMVAAIQAIEAHLKDKEFTDSLWKPVDYACDELDLAVWNMYGKVTVGDSLVFDEGILRSRCDDLALDTVDNQVSLGKLAAANPSAKVEDRQYPYKMIGHSWSNENRLYVYRTSGSETQFVKHRKKFFTTAWWGTDASRIGVRTYYFTCGSRARDYTKHERVCLHMKSESDWNANDDYVSERFINTLADVKVMVSLQPMIAMYPDINFGSSKVYDAVVGMHSVNHAGLIFRAISSSGLGVINGGPIRQYVTW